MDNILKVKLPREILVKGKKVTSVTVRIPTVGDEMRASKMARFATPSGYMQVDEGIRDLYILSAVANIPVTDLEKLHRQEYALITSSLGNLEMSVLVEETQEDTQNSESK